MHVLIAYNDPVLPPTHRDADSEHEILNVVGVVATELDRGGFEVERCGVGRNVDAIRTVLQDRRPQVVCNMFEGLGDDPAAECRFARILEEEGVPFTGCSSRALWQAGRKDIAKKLFRQADVPTPDFIVVNELPLANFRLEFPLIVKPAFQDASIGIDQQSVVADESKLRKQVARLADEYGFPILVEEFIRGREISAAVVDWPKRRMLPPVETLFVGRNGDWPIVSYDCKWTPGSAAYASTPLRYPVELATRLAERLAVVAERAFHVLGCRDFATVDFRLSDDGTPYLLEVNPNPGMSPSPCLVHSFELAGLRYNDFLVQMINAAKSRTSSAVRT
jgi:D-alanine-D-alanine ligase